MDLKKNQRINSLLDFYKGLLTKKQADYAEEYYADDYSLGEIAENFQVSRQAVYDNLNHTVETLEEYEQKLHLLSEFEARNRETDTIRDYVKKNYPNDEHLNGLINRLETTEED